MCHANPTWGAPRIHGELLKLGIAIAEATVGHYMVRRRPPPSQTWRTFLTNHIGQLVSVDFFVVPTLTFRVLFVFVVLAHDRRQILHVNVTGYPTAAWTAQQIRNAFPWDTAPRFLLRDRDGTYGHNFRAISEFPKGRKYLISLSFRGKASVRPAQVGGFDVNIVIHESTAVRGRGDLVAYRWALWKLTAPWTHRTRPPHRGKRCAFSTSFHRAFPIKSFTKNPERPQNSVGKPG